MEVAIVVLVLIGLLIPGTLMFWAMCRSTSLTKRLHPLTPEQQRRKRKAYAMMIPVVVVAIAVGAAIGSGGKVAVVGVAILAAVLLVDALLTPWLYYRRNKRKARLS